MVAELLVVVAALVGVIGSSTVASKGGSYGEERREDGFVIFASFTRLEMLYIYLSEYSPHKVAFTNYNYA